MCENFLTLLYYLTTPKKSIIIYLMYLLQKYKIEYFRVHESIADGQVCFCFLEVVAGDSHTILDLQSHKIPQETNCLPFAPRAEVDRKLLA